MKTLPLDQQRVNREQTNAHRSEANRSHPSPIIEVKGVSSRVGKRESGSSLDNILSQAQKDQIKSKDKHVKVAFHDSTQGNEVDKKPVTPDKTFDRTKGTTLVIEQEFQANSDVLENETHERIESFLQNFESIHSDWEEFKLLGYNRKSPQVNQEAIAELKKIANKLCQHEDRQVIYRAREVLRLIKSFPQRDINTLVSRKLTHHTEKERGKAVVMVAHVNASITMLQDGLEMLAHSRQKKLSQNLAVKVKEKTRDAVIAEALMYLSQGKENQEALKLSLQTILDEDKGALAKKLTKAQSSEFEATCTSEAEKFREKAQSLQETATRVSRSMIKVKGFLGNVHKSPASIDNRAKAEEFLAESSSLLKGLSKDISDSAQALSPQKSTISKVGTSVGNSLIKALVAFDNPDYALESAASKVEKGGKSFVEGANTLKSTAIYGTHKTTQAANTTKINHLETAEQIVDSTARAFLNQMLGAQEHITRSVEPLLSTLTTMIKEDEKLKEKLGLDYLEDFALNGDISTKTIQKALQSKEGESRERAALHAVLDESLRMSRTQESKESRSWFKSHENLKQSVGSVNPSIDRAVSMMSDSNLQLVQKRILDRVPVELKPEVTKCLAGLTSQIVDYRTQLEKSVKALKTVVSLSGRGDFEGARKITLAAKKDAEIVKQEIKTKSTELTGESLHSYSRHGRLAKSIGEWINNTKVEFSDEPKEVVEIIDHVLQGFEHDGIDTLLSKRGDPLAILGGERVKNAESEAAEKMLLWGKSAAEIMKERGDLKDYFFRWGEKNVSYAAAVSLIGGAVGEGVAALEYLADFDPSLKPKMGLLKVALAPLTMEIGIRKLKNSVKPGQDLPFEEINQYVREESLKAAFRLATGLMPRGAKSALGAAITLGGLATGNSNLGKTVKSHFILDTAYVTGFMGARAVADEVIGEVLKGKTLSEDIQPTEELSNAFDESNAPSDTYPAIARGKGEYKEAVDASLEKIAGTSFGRDLLESMNQQQIRITMPNDSVHTIEGKHDHEPSVANHANPDKNMVFFDPHYKPSTEDIKSRPWLDCDSSVVLFHEMLHLYYSENPIQFDISGQTYQFSGKGDPISEHMVAGADYVSEQGVEFRFSDPEWVKQHLTAGQYVNENDLRKELGQPIRENYYFDARNTGANQARFFNPSSSVEEESSLAQYQENPNMSEEVQFYKDFFEDEREALNKVNKAQKEFDDAKKLPRYILQPLMPGSLIPSYVVNTERTSKMNGSRHKIFVANGQLSRLRTQERQFRSVVPNQERLVYAKLWRAEVKEKYHNKPNLIHRAVEESSNAEQYLKKVEGDIKNGRNSQLESGLFPFRPYQTLSKFKQGTKAELDSAYESGKLRNVYTVILSKLESVKARLAEADITPEERQHLNKQKQVLEQAEVALFAYSSSLLPDIRPLFEVESADELLGVTSTASIDPRNIEPKAVEYLTLVADFLPSPVNQQVLEAFLKSELKKAKLNHSDDTQVIEYTLLTLRNGRMGLENGEVRIFGDSDYPNLIASSVNDIDPDFLNEILKKAGTSEMRGTHYTADTRVQVEIYHSKVLEGSVSFSGLISPDFDLSHVSALFILNSDGNRIPSRYNSEGIFESKERIEYLRRAYHDDKLESVYTEESQISPSSDRELIDLSIRFRLGKLNFRDFISNIEGRFNQTNLSHEEKSSLRLWLNNYRNAFNLDRESLSKALAASGHDIYDKIVWVSDGDKYSPTTIQELVSSKELRERFQSGVVYTPEKMSLNKGELDELVTLYEENLALKTTQTVPVLDAMNIGKYLSVHKDVDEDEAYDFNITVKVRVEGSQQIQTLSVPFVAAMYDIDGYLASISSEDKKYVWAGEIVDKFPRVFKQELLHIMTSVDMEEESAFLQEQEALPSQRKSIIEMEKDMSANQKARVQNLRYNDGIIRYFDGKNAELTRSNQGPRATDLVSIQGSDDVQVPLLAVVRGDVPESLKGQLIKPNGLDDETWQKAQNGELYNEIKQAIKQQDIDAEKLDTFCREQQQTISNIQGPDEYIRNWIRDKSNLRPDEIITVTVKARANPSLYANNPQYRAEYDKKPPKTYHFTVYEVVTGQAQNTLKQYRLSDITPKWPRNERLARLCERQGEMLNDYKSYIGNIKNNDANDMDRYLELVHQQTGDEKRDIIGILDTLIERLDQVTYTSGERDIDFALEVVKQLVGVADFFLPFGAIKSYVVSTAIEVGAGLLQAENASSPAEKELYRLQARNAFINNTVMSVPGVLSSKPLRSVGHRIQQSYSLPDRNSMNLPTPLEGSLKGSTGTNHWDIGKYYWSRLDQQYHPLSALRTKTMIESRAYSAIESNQPHTAMENIVSLSKKMHQPPSLSEARQLNRLLDVYFNKFIGGEENIIGTNIGRMSHGDIQTKWLKEIDIPLQNNLRMTPEQITDLRKDFARLLRKLDVSDTAALQKVKNALDELPTARLSRYGDGQSIKQDYRVTDAHGNRIGTIEISGTRKSIDKTMAALDEISNTGSGVRLLQGLADKGVKVQLPSMGDVNRVGADGQIYAKNSAAGKMVSFDPENRILGRDASAAEGLPHLERDPSIGLFHELLHIYNDAYPLRLPKAQGGFLKVGGASSLAEESRIVGIEFRHPNGDSYDFSSSEFVESHLPEGGHYLTENMFRREHAQNLGQTTVYRPYYGTGAQQVPYKPAEVSGTTHETEGLFGKGSNSGDFSAQDLKSYRQKLETIEITKKKVPSDSSRVVKGKEAFHQGSSQTTSGEYRFLDQYSLKQKMEALDSNQLLDGRELDSKTAGALHQKAKSELGEIVAERHIEKASDWAKSAKKSGGDDFEIIPQGQYLKLSGGECRPTSMLMAYAIETGNVRNFASRLKNIGTQESSLYKLLTDLHGGGTQSTKQFNELIKNMQPNGQDAGVQFKLNQLSESSVFLDGCNSARIDITGHSMSMSKFGSKYYFFEPNYGVVSFKSFDKMKSFIGVHLKSEKFGYSDFKGDVNIVQLKFADNDIATLKLNGETLSDVVSKQDFAGVAERKEMAAEGLMAFDGPSSRQTSGVDHDDVGASNTQSTSGFVPYDRPGGEKYIYFPVVDHQRVSGRLIPLLRDLRIKGGAAITPVFRDQGQIVEFRRILNRKYGPEEFSALEPELRYLYKVDKTDLSDLDETSTLYVSGHGQPGSKEIDGQLFSSDTSYVARELHRMKLPDVTTVKVATCNSAVGNPEPIRVPESLDAAQAYAYVTNPTRMGPFDDSFAGDLENKLIVLSSEREPGKVYGYLGNITWAKTETVIGKIENGQLVFAPQQKKRAEFFGFSSGNKPVINFRRSDMMRGRFYDPNPMLGRHGPQDLSSEMPTIDRGELKANHQDVKPEVTRQSGRALIQAQGGEPSKKVYFAEAESRQSRREARHTVWENSTNSSDTPNTDVFLSSPRKPLNVEEVVKQMDSGLLQQYDEATGYIGANPASFVRIVRVSAHSYEITIETLETEVLEGDTQETTYPEPQSEESLPLPPPPSRGRGSMENPIRGLGEHIEKGQICTRFHSEDDKVYYLAAKFSGPIESRPDPADTERWHVVKSVIRGFAVRSTATSGRRN